MAPRADGTTDHEHVHHVEGCEGGCDGACAHHDHGEQQAIGEGLDGSDGDITYVTDHTALLAYADDGWDHLRWNAPLETGTAVVVSYSFDNVADIDASNPYGASSYWAFDATQQAQFVKATEIFSAVTGVMFAEVSGEAMLNVYGASGVGVGGWADYSFSTTYSTGNGDLVNAYSGMNEGQYGFQVLLHELGHALGLSHPFEYEDRTLDPSVDNQNSTVMTYNSTNPYTSVLGNLDIDALHDIYGDGSAQADWVVTTNGSNVVEIRASEGADTVLATGNDTRIDGLGGDDHIQGREANDILNGQSGDDTIYGLKGEDTVQGGAGNDTVYGDSPNSGNVGDDDLLYGNRGNDLLYGQLGDDRMEGGRGNDIGMGGWGDDLFFGGNGNDTVDGEQGNDDLRGNRGHDEINGDDGNDKLKGNDGDDLLNGGWGNDALNGGTGDDTLNGESGDDMLYGGDDDDVLNGGFGVDRLKGNDGNDTLNGGDGDDEMFGGAGADVFLFAYDDAFETNTILDFENGTDTIRIIELSLNYGNITISAGDNAADSVITYSNWFRVEVEGVTTAELDSSDFLFV